MILLEHDLLGPLGIGRVSFQTYLSSKDIYSTLQVEAFTRSPFGTQLFANLVASVKILVAMATKMVATWGVATCRGLPNRAYFEPSPSPLTFEYLPCSPRTSHKVQNNLKWWYGNENCQTVFHWLLHKQFFFCFKLSLPSQQSYSLRGGH